MRVLVTGTDGYLGAVLGPVLRSRGHEVTGLDTGFFREGELYPPSASIPLVCKDVRQLVSGDLTGFDAVVHLAELSNDPLGQLNPSLTYRINHQAGVRLAGLCREAGVERFVYSSSCSVYGVGVDECVSERSPVNPQTVYAECKVLVERDVALMTDSAFAPTFLRNATAFGPSPRMRFDLVVNNLAGLAWTTGEIRMTSDGTPWRPLVHVLDICQAVACVLEAPPDAVRGQIFNVGADEENYRVREIAGIVAEVFPGCRATFGPSTGDTRSYRVSFAKIREHLPAFACRHTTADGARQLREMFTQVGLTPALFNARPFTRLRQLQYLLDEGRLDADLFWVR